jgi:GNAT superfamily N-acetyltransferase
MKLAAVEPATPEDIPSLLEMLGEVAEFLGVAGSFTNTQESLGRALFGTPSTCEAMVARDAGRPAGFALWSEFYRPFSGRPALWLDYIYVRPEFRRKPLAMAMLVKVLALARERGYVSIYGLVFEWNEAARTLYALLHVEELDVRLFNFRLDAVDWSRFGQDLQQATSGGAAPD